MGDGIKAAQHGKGAPDAARQMQAQAPGAHQAQAITEEKWQDDEETEQRTEKGELEAVERSAQQLHHHGHGGKHDTAKDNPQYPMGIIG